MSISVRYLTAGLLAACALMLMWSESASSSHPRPAPAVTVTVTAPPATGPALTFVSCTIGPFIPAGPWAQPGRGHLHGDPLRPRHRAGIRRRDLHGVLRRRLARRQRRGIRHGSHRPRPIPELGD